MPEPPGTRRKILLKKEEVATIIPQIVNTYLQENPPTGGSSGNVDGGYPDSIYGGQAIIDGGEI